MGRCTTGSPPTVESDPKRSASRALRAAWASCRGARRGRLRPPPCERPAAAVARHPTSATIRGLAWEPGSFVPAGMRARCKASRAAGSTVARPPALRQEEPLPGAPLRSITRTSARLKSLCQIRKDCVSLFRHSDGFLIGQIRIQWQAGMSPSELFALYERALASAAPIRRVAMGRFFMTAKRTR